MLSLGSKLCKRYKLSNFFRNYSFRPVTHVIFDLDGTILDSESIYESIYNKVLTKYGKKMNKEVRAAITGTNEQYAVRKMVEMLELPITPDQYWHQIEELSRVDLVNPGIKPGAERLIRHLTSNKIPLAIATSGSERAFKLKCSSRLDIFGLFHHIVHGSSDPEVIYGKPAPDIFLVAARRFPVPAPNPDKCLVFEDAPKGLRGALDAGMQVVMVPEQKWTQEETRGASLILKSLVEFIPEEFGLPAYNCKGSSTLVCNKSAISKDNIILHFTKPRGLTLGYFCKRLINKAVPKNPVTHVIFDLDGTLLDTENVVRDTFRNMLNKEYDKKYDDETHKAIVGMKTLDRCKYLVRKLDLPVTAEQLYQRVQGMRTEIFSNSKLKPGAEKLVTHLHASKVPIAIATGTSKATYDIKTKYHPKLFSLFHHVVNASSDPEVPVGKPDPRIYLVCLKRFEKKPRPEECLVFEDSYNGLLAATRSRTQVVFVPELAYPEVEMKYAVMMIKSLEDFKPEEFSLPPYPKA